MEEKQRKERKRNGQKVYCCCCCCLLVLFSLFVLFIFVSVAGLLTVLLCSHLRQTFPLPFFVSRHFLFKHGSGSSTLFNATNQNYPLTSSTVYSPPPRPLPRSPISRPLFSFSKPYRCCNWKCTALSAAAVTVTLALLLTYVIGKHSAV